MSFEEPTQRVRRPGADAPTTALAGPLNLTGPTATAAPDAGADPATDRAGNGTTDVLSLDELFDGEATPASPPTGGPAAIPPVEEAPTWTAMPVVPVRSEPFEPLGTPAPNAPAQEPLGGRMRTDATAAWEAAVRRTRAWLARDDNGLTLATALVAVILIIAVAGLH